MKTNLLGEKSLGSTHLYKGIPSIFRMKFHYRLWLTLYLEVSRGDRFNTLNSCLPQFRKGFCQCCRCTEPHDWEWYMAEWCNLTYLCERGPRVACLLASSPLLTGWLASQWNETEMINYRAFVLISVSPIWLDHAAPLFLSHNIKRSMLETQAGLDKLLHIDSISARLSSQNPVQDGISFFYCQKTIERTSRFKQ